MKKLISRFFFLVIFLLSTFYFLPSTIYAICPVCTIAVGAGLGLSRYFGIDDVISGLWVGGLILSSSLWMANWLHKKELKIKIHILNFTVAAVFYLITLVPLYFTGIIGHPYNTIYGIDKLLFGTTIGSIVFLLSLRLDKMARKYYGRQFFNYQKVVFPVSALIILSLIFYTVIKY